MLDLAIKLLVAFFQSVVIQQQIGQHHAVGSPQRKPQRIAETLNLVLDMMAERSQDRLPVKRLDSRAAYDTTKQGVLFKNLSKKAVVAKFDQDHASSDAGAVLLKACDEKLKLSITLASCLSDDCQQSKVTHSLAMKDSRDWHGRLPQQGHVCRVGRGINSGSTVRPADFPDVARSRSV